MIETHYENFNQPQTRLYEQRNERSWEIISIADNEREENYKVKAFQNNQTSETLTNNEINTCTMIWGNHITSPQIEECGKLLNFQERQIAYQTSFNQEKFSTEEKNSRIQNVGINLKTDNCTKYEIRDFFNIHFVFHCLNPASLYNFIKRHLTKLD